jgi:uncharacterized membrane protein
MIELSYEGRRVFRPVSLLYLLMLLLSLIGIIAVAYFLLEGILVTALGIPVYWVGIFLFVSLFGSFLDFPVGTIESRVPILNVNEVVAFGVRWQLPSIRVGVARTHILINLGGAVLPIVVSGYLLGTRLINNPGRAIDEYLAIAAVLVIVTVLVNRSASVVKGFGVATPALAPPLITILATILVDNISPLRSPTQVAYFGGRLVHLSGPTCLTSARFATSALRA